MSDQAFDVAAMKRVARAEAKDRLGGLTPIRDEVSTKIIEHLVSYAEWARASTVMAYLAMPSEVCLDGLWKIKNRPTIAAPRVDWGTGVMHPARLDDLARDTETRAHGVREPMAHLPTLEPEALDLVLVPGLAFDARGRRLGRGGGCYDRFLPRATGATRVGVCWSGQVVERIPTGEQDARVQMLLTEHGMQQCSGGPE